MDHTLPTIDWDLGKKLAGNDMTLAKDILAMLVKNLPSDLVKIKKLYSEQNYSELKQQLHRLRGAVVYCGVPRLKAVLLTIEGQLKSPSKESLRDLFDQFYSEVDNLKKAYEQSIS